MALLNAYRPYSYDDPLDNPGGGDVPVAPVPPPSDGGGGQLPPPTGDWWTNTPPGGGGGGGGNGGGGGYTGPMEPQFNVPGAPEFTAPQFNRPTMQDAYNEPGYQFRLQSGSDALERSASARGVLRTGGTLKDILEYGQNFGAQEYGQVYNRALAGYNADYRGAYDAFAPRLAEWQARTEAERLRGLGAFQRPWDVYQFGRKGGGGGGFDQQMLMELDLLGDEPDYSGA